MSMCENYCCTFKMSEKNKGHLDEISSSCDYELKIYNRKKVLVYHPSNSKKGFPIKGTNLRVSFKYI